MYSQFPVLGVQNFRAVQISHDTGAAGPLGDLGGTAPTTIAQCFQKKPHFYFFFLFLFSFLSCSFLFFLSLFFRASTTITQYFQKNPHFCFLFLFPFSFSFFFLFYLFLFFSFLFSLFFTLILYRVSGRYGSHDDSQIFSKET